MERVDRGGELTVEESYPFTENFLQSPETVSGRLVS